VASSTSPSAPNDPDQCTTASDTLEREERTIDSPSDILRRTLPKPDLEAVQTTVNVHVVEAPAGWATPPRAITGVLTRGGWTMSCVRDRVAFRGLNQTTLWGSG